MRRTCRTQSSSSRRRARLRTRAPSGACVFHARVRVPSWQLDADASGELNESEFARGLARYGIVESKARQIFREIDADGTGTLTLEELAAVANQVMAARHEKAAMAPDGAEPSGDSTLRFAAEFVLSFVWRSVPDLAAETLEAESLTAALVPAA